MNTTNTNSSPSLERIPIENTPFVIVGNETDGWMITIGDYKISELHSSIDKLMIMIEDKDWTFLMNVINAMIINEKRHTEENKYNGITEKAYNTKK